MQKKYLTKYERRIVEAIASTIIPNPWGPFKKSVKDVGIADKVDRAISYLSFDVRISYRLFLFIMEIKGLFYKFRFRLFTKMKREERQEYLRAWHRTMWSPKRAIFRFVEAIINLNYYGLPEVSEECGYRPHFAPALPAPKYSEAGLFKVPLTGDHEISVDVCIVGSGAGGAAAAKELAESGRSVVVLEEGSLHAAHEYGKDVVTMTELLYRDGGILATFGWPNILVPLGCCVGGTTVINSGTCYRCPDYVLERWNHEYGLSKWSPEKLRPLFEKVESILGVEKAEQRVLSKNTDVFKRGLDRLGLKGGVLKRNAPNCSGSGVCCFGCPTNAKKSVDMNFIPMALDAGAKLYTN